MPTRHAGRCICIAKHHADDLVSQIHFTTRDHDGTPARPFRAFLYSAYDGHDRLRRLIVRRKIPHDKLAYCAINVIIYFLPLTVLSTYPG